MDPSSRTIILQNPPTGKSFCSSAISFYFSVDQSWYPFAGPIWLVKSAAKLRRLTNKLLSRRSQFDLLVLHRNTKFSIQPIPRRSRCLLVCDPYQLYLRSVVWSWRLYESYNDQITEALEAYASTAEFYPATSTFVANCSFGRMPKQPVVSFLAQDVHPTAYARLPT